MTISFLNWSSRFQFLRSPIKTSFWRASVAIVYPFIALHGTGYSNFSISSFSSSKFTQVFPSFYPQFDLFFCILRTNIFYFPLSPKSRTSLRLFGIYFGFFCVISWSFFSLFWSIFLFADNVSSLLTLPNRSYISNIDLTVDSSCPTLFATSLAGIWCVLCKCRIWSLSSKDRDCFGLNLRPLVVHLLSEI